MEGFKNKLVNGDIKIAADEWITQALLRELRKDETLWAKFEKDFDGLTFDSKKALIELAERVQIKGVNGQDIMREATSYDLPSFREEEYKLVDSVEIGERLSALESDITDIFPELSQEDSKDDTPEFVGPPEAPIEQKVSEVEDNEKVDEKPFDLADLPDFDNLSQAEKTKLVNQILDTDTPGQTLDDFIANTDKVSEWEGPMTDAWGVEFNIFFPDALPNTSEENVYMQFPILVKYIEEGTYLRNDRNPASNW